MSVTWPTKEAKVAQLLPHSCPITLGPFSGMFLPSGLCEGNGVSDRWKDGQGRPQVCEASPVCLLRPAGAERCCEP